MKVEASVSWQNCPDTVSERELSRNLNPYIYADVSRRKIKYPLMYVPKAGVGMIRSQNILLKCCTQQRKCVLPERF